VRERDRGAADRGAAGTEWAAAATAGDGGRGAPRGSGDAGGAGGERAREAGAARGADWG